MSEPRVMLGVGSYDRQGGTNTFVRNLSANLSEKNIYTVVMSHKLAGETFQDRRINDNLYVAYFPAFPRKRHFLPLYVLRFIWMAIALIPVILKHRINVILTGETEALPFSIAKLFGVKVIIRGGNPFPEVTKVELEKKKVLNNRFVFFLIDVYEKIILMLADDIVILSEWEEKILSDYTHKQFKMIRYAVNTKTFEPSKKKTNNYLLYVGRISPSKHIDTLVRCFDSIRAKVDTKLILVGNLEDYENVDMFRKNSKYSKDIIYLGEKGAKEIPAILRDHYIFVHVAHDLGNAPLEAASTGLPIVVLGTKFDEKYVITAASEKEYAQKVIDLLKDKDLYAKVSKHNREFVVGNHSWEHITAQYMKLFKEATSKHGK